MMKKNKNVAEGAEFDFDTVEEMETDGAESGGDNGVSYDGYDDGYDDDFITEDYAMPAQRYSDLLKELTNFEEYLRSCVRSWRGLTMDEDTGKWIPDPELKPMMSKKGADWCYSYLRTYARNNNIITDIETDEYKYIMSSHIEAVLLNLGTRDDLGVTDNGDLIRIANEMEHAALLALVGAWGGKYNKLFGEVMQHREMVQPHNIQSQALQKKGFFNKIGRFLAGK